MCLTGNERASVESPIKVTQIGVDGADNCDDLPCPTDCSLTRVCQELYATDNCYQRDAAHYLEVDMYTSLPTTDNGPLRSIGDEMDGIETGLAGVSIDPIFEQNEDGDTRLHLAIIFLDGQMAGYYINQALDKATLSVRNNMLQAPLHLSVLTKQAAVTRQLVIAGADLSVVDRRGNNPLHLACKDGDIESVRAILTPVQCYEMFCNQFKNQYNIEDVMAAVNFSGETCLHLAASGGHLEIVKLLLDSGIDVNIKERKTGNTILHSACVTGDIGLVRVLLKVKTCDINAKTYDGLAPFDLARSRSNEEICITLAAAGATFGNDEGI